MDAQTELIMSEKRDIEKQRKLTQKMILTELKKTQNLDASSKYEFSRVNAMITKLTHIVKSMFES